MEISYYDYLRDVGSVYIARNRVLDCLKKNEWNMLRTAREMKTTRDTVRLIRGLFQAGGAGSLEDRRKGPKVPHNKIEPQVEKLIKDEYDQGSIKTLTNFRKFFNNKYQISYSYKVFRRVLKDKRKKRKPKRIKKHKKAYWREKIKIPFKFWQFDPKYLDDIEYFYPQMVNLNLPRYQLGFRDVVSGTTFISYTYSLSKSVVENSLVRFLAHLTKFDIPLNNFIIQTDNGGEIIGSTVKKDLPFFTKAVSLFGGEHRRIPKGACWKQGYIESYNHTCELDFYQVEDFKSLKDFIEKAFTYQLVYNLLRCQDGLNDKTPFETARKYYPNLNEKFFIDLPPIIYKGDEPSPAYLPAGKAGFLEEKGVDLFRVEPRSHIAPYPPILPKSLFKLSCLPSAEWV